MFKISLYIILFVVGIMAKRVEVADTNILRIYAHYCLIIGSMYGICVHIDRKFRH
jgi:hypothetical protein